MISFVGGKANCFIKFKIHCTGHKILLGMHNRLFLIKRALSPKFFINFFLFKFLQMSHFSLSDYAQPMHHIVRFFCMIEVQFSILCRV